MNLKNFIKFNINNLYFKNLKFITQIPNKNISDHQINNQILQKTDEIHKPLRQTQQNIEQSTQQQFIRLSKLMTQKGLCSRREADQYIQQGLVILNGNKIDQLGYKINIDDINNVQITFNDEFKKLQKRKVTIMLNKPYDYVSNLPEHGNKSALQLLSLENQFKQEKSGLKSYINQSEQQNEIAPKYFHGLAPCGRLDLHSQGLMIYTQDGRVAKSIINEQLVEKEYIVRVNEKVPFTKLKQLREGKLIVNGSQVKKAFVERINNEQLRFILTEGKKRQIRQMCEQVGLKVSGLKRVRIGKLLLGNLPEGQWRYLTDSEINQFLKNNKSKNQEQKN